MKIHHLNCASLHPLGQPFVPALLVTHCLLLEDRDGLTLVDSGLGTQDIATPEILGGRFLTTVRPKLDLRETAIKQIENLGFKRDDVKNIVLTHLDLDHTGGLGDFPQARVHVLDQEHQAAMNPQTRFERDRYVQKHWAHLPKWVLAKLSEKNWFGLPCTNPLPDMSAEILLVFLPGHTWGHCGVAIQTKEHELLHAGDSYFYHGEMNVQKQTRPLGVRIFQKIVQVDGKQNKKTQGDLYQVLQKTNGSIHHFCSHDPDELQCFQNS